MLTLSNLINNQCDIDNFIKINQFIERDEIKMLIIGISEKNGKYTLWTLQNGNFPEEVFNCSNRRMSRKENILHQLKTEEYYHQNSLLGFKVDDSKNLISRSDTHFLNSLNADELSMLLYFNSDGINMDEFLEMPLNNICLNITELRERVDFDQISQVTVELKGRNYRNIVDHSFDIDFSKKGVQSLEFVDPHNGELSEMLYRPCIVDTRKEMKDHIEMLKERNKDKAERLEAIEESCNMEGLIAFVEVKHVDHLGIFAEDYLNEPNRRESRRFNIALIGNNPEGFLRKELKTVDEDFNGIIRSNILTLTHTDPRIEIIIDLND